VAPEEILAKDGLDEEAKSPGEGNGTSLGESKEACRFVKDGGR